jgi:hypothetical protein
MRLDTMHVARRQPLPILSFFRTSELHIEAHTRSQRARMTAAEPEVESTRKPDITENASKFGRRERNQIHPVQPHLMQYHLLRDDRKMTVSRRVVPPTCTDSSASYP